MSLLLDAPATARLLPYPALVDELERVLVDASVQVPPRLVQALPGGGSLFVMPALDAATAMTKLITFTPANAGTTRPTIQGDVVVFDLASGERRLVLDGPTVTARRTAAVSVLAARWLAPQTQGPLLIVGAGAQGRSHLQAFAECLPLREVRIASRSVDSAQDLCRYAASLGLRSRVATDPDEALAECPLVVTCTPARGAVLSATARDDGFIAAVGAFTPGMVELAPGLCRQIATGGSIWLDTADARHEAGDLLQAGLDLSGLATLADRARQGAGVQRPAGPVLFKSCGWAGWDLAAARLAISGGHAGHAS